MVLDMPTCVSIMANNELEELETILRKKYKKFKWVYRFICRYNDQIEEIHYKKGTDESELVIDLDFSEDSDLDDAGMQLSNLFETVLTNYPEVDCQWMRQESTISIFLSMNEI